MRSPNATEVDRGAAAHDGPARASMNTTTTSMYSRCFLLGFLYDTC